MGSEERTLEATATWAVVLVCFILVAISLAIEKLIHHLGSCLRRKKKASLYEALEKIKAELMLMGFISLLLTVGESPLSRICVPRNVGHSWFPCRGKHEDREYDDPCLERGKVQLVSEYGIHQLHIFVFSLAVVHLLYCIATYGLASLKMRQWKSWEDETKTVQFQDQNDPERYRFARDTSFGQRHLQFWSKSTLLLWIVSFLRQFLGAVTKVDYLTLRHGFVTAHLTSPARSSFDFHKYIERSLEEDFKTVVEISPVIWASALLFLLTNTNGWYSEYWLPFIPLIVILLVGAKLQVVITEMGTRFLERGFVVKGTPLVQPGDHLFWFNRPRLILFFIHLVLFQNAFQLAFLAWSLYEFHYPSCYYENLADVLIRVVMGVLIHGLCSYVTLPLYALVTQMGSSMKPVIFSDGVATALRSWHKTARKRIKQGRTSARITPASFSSRNENSVESGYGRSGPSTVSTSPPDRGGEYLGEIEVDVDDEEDVY